MPLPDFLVFCIFAKKQTNNIFQVIKQILMLGKVNKKMQLLNDDLFRETIQTHPDLCEKVSASTHKLRLTVGRMALMAQGEKAGF